MGGAETAHAWSIVTVTYNSADDIRTFWSHHNAPSGVEWIVVDNASSDGSAEAAELAGADKVIRLASNRGFGAANNVGLGASTGKFVLFANPDLQVEYDGLTRLASCIETQKGLVAPQLLGLDDTPQPNGRGLPTIWNKLGNRLRRDTHETYRLFAQPGELRTVCFAIGAAIAGARSEIDALHGWDETFFVYYEDSDICLREWRAGGHVTLVGDVRWRHKWARETSALRWEPWRLELASMLRFYSRYPAMLGPSWLASRAFPMIHRAMSAQENA